MFSRSPSQPDDEREDEAEAANPGGSSTLLKLGTLAVIGAMAANVFGFRYSRWAVGKEIHRGWETHARNTTRQAARARANARRAEHTRAQEAKRRAEERAEQGAKEHSKRAKREKQERDSTKRAYQRWEESFDNSGRRYQRWEETFDNGYRVHIEFDSRFEEFFKGGPFGMSEEVLREFLRSAQRETRGRGEFDAFRFWEEVHGERWRSGGMGSGGGMGGSGASTGGSGIFSGNRARHYAALGLREGASAGEVKNAYRKEAMKWHPDRYRGNDREGAARKFREITEAYQALK